MIHCREQKKIQGHTNTDTYALTAIKISFFFFLLLQWAQDITTQWARCKG